MHKWMVGDQVVELADYDYYNQWLGALTLTQGLQGLLGGYFDMHDRQGNLLEKYAEYIHENSRLVEDSLFGCLLKEYETQFAEIIALDREAVCVLAGVLGVEAPKNARDYRRLYRKTWKAYQLIHAGGFFGHPAFDELRQRFQECSAKLILLREKLIAAIIETQPDLARSEFLVGR